MPVGVRLIFTMRKLWTGGSCCPEWRQWGVCRDRVDALTPETPVAVQVIPREKWQIVSILEAVKILIGLPPARLVMLAGSRTVWTPAQQATAK